MTALLATVLPPLLGALAPVAVGLVLALLRTALLRVNIKLTTEQEAAIRGVVEKAVHAAEESSGPSIYKLTAATRAVSAKYPKMPVDEIYHAIHAEIGRQRADPANDVFKPRAKK